MNNQCKWLKWEVKHTPSHEITTSAQVEKVLTSREVWCSMPPKSSLNSEQKEKIRLMVCEGDLEKCPLSKEDRLLADLDI